MTKYRTIGRRGLALLLTLLVLSGLLVTPVSAASGGSGYYYLSMAETENGSFTVQANGKELAEYSNGSGLYRVMLDDVITITPVANDGYGVCKVETSSDDGDTREVLTAGTDGGYSFNMPAANLEVYVTFTKVYTVSSTGTGAVVTGLPKSAAAGTTVTFTAAPETGYRLRSISVNGAVISDTTVTGATEYSFTMPAENAVVTAVTAQYWEDYYDETFYNTYKDGFPEGVTEIHITTAEQFAALIQIMEQANLNKCDGWFDDGTVLLDNNIDLSGKEWHGNRYSLGNSATTHAFRFDGQGHTVSGMTITDADNVIGTEGEYSFNNSSGASLFGFLYGGEIKNLTVSGRIELTGQVEYAAGISGYLQNCYDTGGEGKEFVAKLINLTSNVDISLTSSGNMTQIKVGGIVGYLFGTSSPGTQYTVLENCKNTGTISANGVKVYVGGLVGWLESQGGTGWIGSYLTDCVNTGSVTATASGNASVGGLVGEIEAGGSFATSNSGVINSYNSAAISAVSSGGNANVGGVVGYMEDLSIVSNSYNAGSVTGSAATTLRLGGVVGDINDSDPQVFNTYNYGKTNGTGSVNTFVGGVVGYAASDATISNSYYQSGKGADAAVASGSASGCEAVDPADAAEKLNANLVVADTAYSYKTWADGSTPALSGTTYTAPESGYDIKLAEAENGSVSIKQHARATAGTVITVYPTADSGYGLTSLSYKKTDDAEAASVDITADANGKYVFTMPGYAITITAAFEKQTLYTVTATTPVMAGETQVGTIKVDSSEAAPGTTVTITTSATKGYTLDADSVTVSRVGGGTVPVSPGSSARKFTFVMPEENVTVTASFTANPAHSMTVASDSEELLTLSSATVLEGAQVKVTVTQPESGTITAIKATGSDGLVYWFNAASSSITVSIPNADLTFSAEVEATWADEGAYDAELYARSAGNWYIYDAADLAALAKKVNSGNRFSGYTVTLMADIDLSGRVWIPIGNGTTNKARFYGTFEGNGHTISGMDQNGSWIYKGLFGYTYKAQINNLTVSGKVTGEATTSYNYAGGVAAYAGSSSGETPILKNVISNVSVGVTVEQTSGMVYAGGLLGDSSASVTNSAARGDVTVTGTPGSDCYVGGIAGYTGTAMAVNNCYYMGSVTGPEGSKVGMMLGYNQKTYTSTEQPSFGPGSTMVGEENTAVPAGKFLEVSGGKVQATLKTDTTTYKNPTLLTALNIGVAAADESDGLREWVKGTPGPVLAEYEDDVSVGSYTITLDVIGKDYGEVEVAPLSKAGSKVKVSVSPKTGYAATTLTYAVDGQTSSMLYSASDGYYFYMPEGDVTVNVEFTYATYALNSAECENGAMSFVVGKASASAALAGATVTVTAEPDTGYLMTDDSLTVKTASGKTVELTYVSALSYTFTMPNEAVTASARFEASETTNTDGTLKPGTYTLTYHQGQGSYSVGTVVGPMGGPVVDGGMTLVVAEDGTMTASWQLKGMLAVGSYYGLGQLYLLTSATDADGDGDIDVYDYWKNRSTGTDGDLIGTNFTPITVLNWGDVNSKTAENVLYEGTVTPSEDGKVFYKADGSRVAPRDVTVTLPAYIKDNGQDNEIYVATYEANAMNTWSVLKYQLDFATIESADKTELTAGDYDVDITVYRGTEPGDTTTLPMGSNAVESPAVLHVAEDGSRSMTVSLTNTYVGGIYGHLASFRVYYADSAYAAYTGSDDGSITPTEVTVNSWYTATTKSATMTSYTGTTYAKTINGGLYYTTDDQEGDFTNGVTNLAYPGSVTFDLPSYTDGTDGKEIYISTFIDAMGSGETVIKLVLGKTSGSSGRTENPLEGLILAVTNAKKLVESDYTAASWATFYNALTAAQALITASSTDEDAIDAAETALTTAQAALVKNSGGTSGGSSSGGSTSGDTTDPTKTGSYTVPIYVYSSKGGGTNMGDGIFENNRNGLVVVSGDTATLEFATNPINKSGVISAVTAMEYSTDGGLTYKSVEVLETATLDISKTTYKPDSGTLPDSITYISRARLTLEEPGAEYVYMRFKVPYTPMDAIGAGDASGTGMSSLIYLDWSNAAETSATSLKPDTSISKGTDDSGEQIKDVVSTDSKTGISLETTTERVGENTSLKVEELTSGSRYELAAEALGDKAADYNVYDIALSEDGDTIEPSGAVTLRFPVEVGETLTVYRISDTGSKTLLTGVLSSDKKYYEVKTTATGLFATTATETQIFADIPVGHWAEEGIRRMVDEGLFKGTGDDQFSPNISMSRAMIFTVLQRLSGAEDTTQTGETWYSSAMEWAIARGITDGSNPDGSITREQLATMLYRYVGSPEVSDTLGSYGDAGEVSSWAENAMKWAVAEGIITGKPGSILDPKGEATRAEAAVMLTRFLDAVEKD